MAAVLVSMICTVGCPASPSETRDATKSPKSAKPAPQLPSDYPRAPWPKERDDTTKGPVTEGIVTVIRTSAGHVTTEDTVDMALRFEGATGPWAKGDADGERRLNTTATLQQTEFIVRRGDEVERLTLAESASSTNAAPIAVRPRALQLSKEGLKRYNKRVPWKVPSKLLGTPGPLTIQLKGKLTLDDKLVPYSSKENSITIVAASPAQQSHAALRAIASAFIQKAEGHKKPPLPSVWQHPIETSTHLVVFRFLLPERKNDYKDTYVDVALSSTGKVVAASQFWHFSCVAGGTGIATPDGTMKVEELTLGDRVWSIDLARNKRITTQVVAVRRGKTERLVLIDGLHVTPTHPLWIGEHGIDGRWVLAGDVARGNIITALTGARRPIAHYATESRAVRVYDLSVQWPHNFFAGGILVHNKSAPIPVSAPGDPWHGLFARGRR